MNIYFSLFIYMTMRNKRWTFGSGFVRDEMLVVLPWTKERSVLAFWPYCFSVIIAHIVLAVLFMKILGQYLFIFTDLITGTDWFLRMHGEDWKFG